MCCLACWLRLRALSDTLLRHRQGALRGDNLKRPSVNVGTIIDGAVIALFDEHSLAARMCCRAWSTPEDNVVDVVGWGAIRNVSMRMRYQGLEFSEQRGCRYQGIGRHLGWGFRQIDADDRRQFGRCRDFPLEALGMRRIGRLQHFGTLLPKRARSSEVHRRRRHEADPGVPVL